MGAGPGPLGGMGGGAGPPGSTSLDAVSKAGQPHPRPGPAFPSGGGPREARSPPPSGTWGPSSEPHTPARVGGRGCRFTPGDPKRHAVCALAGTGPRPAAGATRPSWCRIGSPHPILGGWAVSGSSPSRQAMLGSACKPCRAPTACPALWGSPCLGGDSRPGTVRPAPGGQLLARDWDFASQRISGWPSEEKARLAARHIEARERPGVSGMQTVWSARQQSRRGCRAGRVQPRGKCTVPDRPHASPGGAWVVGWMSSVGEAGLWTGGTHTVLGQLLGDLWPCPPDLRGRGPGGRGCRAHPG